MTYGVEYDFCCLLYIWAQMNPFALRKIFLMTCYYCVIVDIFRYLGPASRPD